MPAQEITLYPGDTLKITVSEEPANPEIRRQPRKESRKTRKNTQAGGKRGANPFMKFAAKERKNILSENPGMAVTEVGKELGKRWRALSEAEKAKF